jgi:hypothetical protein
MCTPHKGEVLTVDDVDLVDGICLKSHYRNCRLSKAKFMILRLNLKIKCVLCYEGKSVTFLIFLFGI